MSLARVVRPERLDALPPEDRAARRSRRDLVRVHLAMGTRGIVARGWRASLVADGHGGPSAGPHRRPVRILELGAGDGTLALALARRLAGELPDVELTLLDRQDIVAPDTLDALERLGWRTRVEIVDVLDWAAGTNDTTTRGFAGEAALGASAAGARDASPSGGHEGGAAPAGGTMSRDGAERRWDLVATALFLHHFEGEALATVLRAVAARADACFAFEPHRGRLALLGSHLVGALGANAVTRTDAVLSVHAGFRERELSLAWPGTAQAWRLDERTAGPFGHAFRARRHASAP